MYVVSALFALPGIVNSAAPVSFVSPNLSLGPVPGFVLGWAWVVTRLGTLLIGAVWLKEGLGPMRLAGAASVVAGVAALKL